MVLKTKIVRGTMKTEKSGMAGFTRPELMFCLFALILLGVVAMPGLSNTRSRSLRIECVDNLRLIGQAVQLWASDHEDKTPWLVNVSEGGTKPDILPPYNKPSAIWFEFSAMSNQLVTPRILVCPQDAQRVVNAARNWGRTSDGGYLNSGYRDNATSYALGLHSFIYENSVFLAGDRNLRVDNPGPVTCSLGFGNTSSINPIGASVTAWTNSIHGLSGNILLADGRVVMAPNSTLKKYFSQRAPQDNRTLHLLIP
jgi:competence protein ComGC